jgi:glutamate racemase
MTTQAHYPIGVFDSGVGGLTVVRALMERLPFENLVYFGDTARVPYGIKSTETIEHFTTEIAQFLLKQPVKMLIMACNTMAAVAAEKVRSLSPVPVLDVITAGAKVAVATSQNQTIGVIGTPTTINSNTYPRHIHLLNPQARVYSQACPLFVPLVEEGWLTHPVTRLTAKEYLQPIFVESIDTLVLGCTHYPLLKPLLLEVVENTLTLIDSAQSIADEAAATLTALQLLNLQRTNPDYHCFVTDIPLKFRTVGERFLGRNLQHLEMLQL